MLSHNDAEDATFQEGFARVQRNADCHEAREGLQRRWNRHPADADTIPSLIGLATINTRAAERPKKYISRTSSDKQKLEKE